MSINNPPIGSPADLMGALRAYARSHPGVTLPQLDGWVRIVTSLSLFDLLLDDDLREVYDLVGLSTEEDIEQAMISTNVWP